MEKNFNPKIRVYMACSLDGYIASSDHDLSWLNRDHSRSGDLPNDTNFIQFENFMSEIGCLLMGRKTYDVIEKMGVWVYGNVPVLIASHNPIQRPIASTVTVIAGTIDELLNIAKSKSGKKDIYVDGASLVQQAISASLIDEITLTYIPIMLGEGIRLFDNLKTSQKLQFKKYSAFSGMLQISADIIK